MPAVANEQFDLPLAKRQKRAPDAQLRAKARGGSKIFAPFRVRLLQLERKAKFHTSCSDR